MPLLSGSACPTLVTTRRAIARFVRHVCRNDLAAEGYERDGAVATSLCSGGARGPPGGVLWVETPPRTLGGPHRGGGPFVRAGRLARAVGRGGGGVWAAGGVLDPEPPA